LINKIELFNQDLPGHLHILIMDERVRMFVGILNQSIRHAFQDKQNHQRIWHIITKKNMLLQKLIKRFVMATNLNW